MKLPAHLLLVLTFPCLAQNVPAPTAPSAQNSNISPSAAQRENALVPAYAAQKAHDNEGAYKLFLQAVEDYPKDARVMMLAAGAARSAGHLQEALTLYDRTMQIDRVYTNRYLPAIIQIYAALNRWTEFDEVRNKAREASLAGDTTLPADRGYIIEDYTDATHHVQVLEFPILFGRFHTRYRFLTVSQFDPNTHFTPYTDLESDDIDQVTFKQQHPDKAAAGDRAFSLDTYPKPGTQGLMRFYDGEPTYETVRAEVFSKLPPASIQSTSSSAGSATIPNQPRQTPPNLPGDSITFDSAVPESGATVRRGQPVPMVVTLTYTLESHDKAYLSLSVAQFHDPNRCATTPAGGGELVVAEERVVERGSGTLTLHITWPGDTGEITRRPIYGQGSLSYMGMFWESVQGRRGNRFGIFSFYQDTCTPF